MERASNETLPAGPELNQLIAAEVIGQKRSPVYRRWGPTGEPIQVRYPSTIMSDAWDVVAHLARNGFAIAVRFNVEPNEANSYSAAGTWTVGILVGRSGDRALSDITRDSFNYLEWDRDEETAETAQLAICRYALKLVRDPRHES